MRIKINLYLPFLCLFLISCSFTSNELKTAEQIIESKPDSALKILQNINHQNIKFDSNRALYGLLMFQALDNCYKPLQPDSLLSFSTEYYQKKNDQPHLAKCYFYRARIYKYAQKYDEATLWYFKSMDCSVNKTDYILLGRIYGDIGDICSFQVNYTEAIKKYQLAVNCFTKIGNSIEANYRIYTIGRTYHLLKDYSRALQIYRKILSNNSDSILQGLAFQEMGGTYYWTKQYDSAQFYLHKSLRYPSIANNYAIRCYVLADLLFDIEKYDSASYYAKISLEHPASFYTKQHCYRILVNVEYLRKDIKQMSKYMAQYQCYSDSVRKVEAQTKFKVLENLHYANQKAKGTKRNMIFTISALLIGLLLSALIVYALYRRYKLKKQQLDLVKLELNQKQQVVIQNLSRKIEEARTLQAYARKRAKPDEKLELDKYLYNNILHLNDWKRFKKEMNQTLNHIIDKLESDYPEMNQKELIWCCLQLLNIPNTEKMLLLNMTSDSLYKLKQRLAQKMNLQSTKELDNLLRNLTTL